MRQMKDSGIEWIGEIPDNWKVGRVKSAFFRKKSEAHQENPVILSLARAGVRVRDISTGEGQIAESYYNYNPVEIGDFLLNPMDLYSGANCSISNTIGVISPAYINLRAYAGFDARYYDYYFKTQYWSMAMFAHGKGVSFDNRWTLNANDLLNYYIPVPSFDEQKRIASFLNQHCEHIDNIIEKTKASIEEYKKLRQAIITQAVTRGVRGDRPMKDTGYDWISQIPADWIMERGKNLFFETNNRSDTGEEELLTVSQYTGITPRSQKNVNMFEAETLEGYKICEIGDIAANTMWLWAGAVGVSEYYGVISPSYNIYRQKSGAYNNKYLDYMLRITPMVQLFASMSTGIRASRLRLYPEQFLSIYYLLPPLEEQKEIVAYLKDKIIEVDNLIVKKRQLLTELDNYKKSMIYEYVTGKKEVVL